MALWWTAHTLAIALAAAPGSTGAKVEPANDTVPAPEPEPPPLPGADLSAPPPGSKADQELWRSGHLATKAVHAERGRATKLQLTLVKLRYGERLGLLAERGGDAGEAAKKLKERLNASHSLQFAALTSRWPVDTYRVCGYPTMEFGSMLVSAAKIAPEDLARHRAMLTGCVEQATGAVNTLKGGNDALAAAMREADAILKTAGLGPTAGLEKPKTPAKADPPAEKAAGKIETAPGPAKQGEKLEKDGK